MKEKILGKNWKRESLLFKNNQNIKKSWKGKVRFAFSVTNLHDISNAYKRQILPLLFRAAYPSSVLMFFCVLPQKLC